MNSEAPTTSWSINLFLAASVVFTLVIALIMSQLDRLQTRLRPTVAAIAQVTAAATNTIPAISLPTATPGAPASDAPVGTSDRAAVPILPHCGDIPDNWVAYLVQPDDTLFSLSIHSGATSEQIALVNCLDIKQLVSGMRVFLPATPPEHISCGPPSWWVRYTVQPGDTMFSLARSRGTTSFEVQTANCFSGDQIIAGRQIYLPPLPASAATSTATFTPFPPTATFMPPPPTAVPQPTTQPTQTPQPTNTLVPIASPTMTPDAATATPTIPAVSTATDTPPPLPPTATDTPPPLPPTATDTPTPVATDTLTPVATDTPIPVATDTPIPAATDTPIPVATDTPIPVATDTPIPVATDTPIPTATP